jgi:hypothetical protein
MSEANMSETVDRWADMLEEDVQYMRGSRVRPARCVWCGGILSHHKLCVTRSPGWRAELSFGRYRGCPIDDVPLEYLSWLLRSPVHLSPEVHEAIDRRLEAARSA